MTDLADRISARKDGHIGRFTIDREEKRNAMALSMWARMGDVFDSWSEDPDIRVAVVRGAGDKCFCAGNDISEFSTVRADAAGAADYEKVTERAYRALKEFPKPTIARVSGTCVGGGLELAQLCDIQIAAETARFGVTPAKLGLGYKLADVMLLTSNLSAKHAKEMLFTGDLFPAAKALQWGLVNRVVEDDALDDEVEALAEKISSNAPLSVKAAKIIVGEAVKETGRRNVDLCQALVDACHDSDDYVEGQEAFAAKRPPQFKGS